MSPRGTHRSLGKEAGLALACLLGCSLLTPPGDYFDPVGHIVTLANVAGTITATATTNDSVFYAIEGQVFRVDKAGSTPVRLNPDENGSVLSLESDGANLVVWCTASLGVSFWTRASGIASVADSVGCSAVAARSGLIGYYQQGGTSGPASLHVYNLATKVTTATKAARLPDEGKLSFLADGTLFLSTGRGIARPCTSKSEKNCFDALCIVSTRYNPTPDRLFVDGDAKNLQILSMNAEGGRKFQNNECCLIDLSTDSDRNCPATFPKITAEPSTVMFRDGFVFQLKEGQLIRRTFEQDDEQGVVVQTGLGANLRHLAVDDEAAYFVQGQRLQRYRPGCALRAMTERGCP